MSKINANLTNLFLENNYDVTLQPQGEGPYGHAVTCKVETMDATEAGLRTKRKVTVTGFANSLNRAETSALRKALQILNLN